MIIPLISGSRPVCCALKGSDKKINPSYSLDSNIVLRKVFSDALLTASQGKSDLSWTPKGQAELKKEMEEQVQRPTPNPHALFSAGPSETLALSANEQPKIESFLTL